MHAVLVDRAVEFGLTGSATEAHHRSEVDGAVVLDGAVEDLGRAETALHRTIDAAVVLAKVQRDLAVASIQGHRHAPDSRGIEPRRAATPAAGTAARGRRRRNDGRDP